MPSDATEEFVRSPLGVANLVPRKVCSFQNPVTNTESVSYGIGAPKTVGSHPGLG